MMVKSQDQILLATKGVGGRRPWAFRGLKIVRGRENGRGKEEKAECIYWVWVLEKPLRLLFFFFFSLKKLFIYLYIFFNIVLTWKIVEDSKVSVLYIYIYIY